MLDYVKSVALLRMEAKTLQDRLNKIKGKNENSRNQTKEYRQLYNLTDLEEDEDGVAEA